MLRALVQQVAQLCDVPAGVGDVSQRSSAFSLPSSAKARKVSESKPGRYRASDKLLRFLDNLWPAAGYAEPVSRQTQQPQQERDQQPQQFGITRAPA